MKASLEPPPVGWLQRVYQREVQRVGLAGDVKISVGVHGDRQAGVLVEAAAEIG